MSSPDLIRAKLVQLLTAVAGVPTPVPERIAPAQVGALPAVSIYLPSETAERALDQFQEKCRARIDIECNVQRSPTFVAETEALFLAIRAKLMINQTLDSLAESCEYIGRNFDLGAVGDVDAIRLTLHYDCVYIYSTTTAADAFNTIGLKIDMAGPRNDPQTPTVPDGQIDASATITLPT
jgi:hypothetical protein